MGFVPKTVMMLYCNNMLAIYIVQNLVFHERTKHIEVDCRVAWRKYDAGLLSQSVFYRSACRFID